MTKHFVSSLLTYYQIPHAFQHHTSHEKIPTLHRTLPAFKAIITKWNEYAEDNPEYSSIVQEGIDKLEEYDDQAQSLPAFVLAMGKSVFAFTLFYKLINITLAVNPEDKLSQLREENPKQFKWARQVFIKVV